MSSENDEELDSDTDEDLTSQPDKYLIFSTGSKTNLPHQIGFKRIGRVSFPKKLDPGPSLAERIAECRERAQRPPVLYENINFDNLSRNFDYVDHLIEFNGHVIGMKLSPDHRPWPEDHLIINPLDRPPIASEIDMHVIDLSTFKEVGKMLKETSTFSRNLESYLMFLDVSNDYVASGTENKGGFLWDRHYGIGLSKLEHDDVVNSVAFNPRNSETLITASDDNTVKIWRSRAQVSKLFGSKSEYPRDVNLSPKKKEVDRTRVGKKLQVVI